MSSIPVRKATGKHLKRRSHDEGHSPPHDETENKTLKTKTRYNSREDNGKHTSRVPTRKGLAEENDILKSEIKAHEQRLKKLETMLRLEKDKVSSLKKESSQKETEYKENLDDITKRSGALETRLESYETKLLKCNIDPVTLDSLEPGSKDSESEARYEHTLVKVRLIKEKFKEFNLQALENIDNLQAMNNQLDVVLTNTQSITSLAEPPECTNQLDAVLTNGHSLAEPLEHTHQLDAVLTNGHSSTSLTNTTQEHTNQAHTNSQPVTSLVENTQEHTNQLDESNDSVYY